MNSGMTILKPDPCTPEPSTLPFGTLDKKSYFRIINTSILCYSLNKPPHAGAGYLNVEPVEKDIS